MNVANSYFLDFFFLLDIERDKKKSEQEEKCARGSEEINIHDRGMKRQMILVKVVVLCGFSLNAGARVK